MEKIDYSQLELFSNSKGPSGANRKTSNSFLSYLWGYEKVILIAIGFLVTGVISFSLGVEKGKHLAMLKSDYQTIKRQPAASTTKVPEEPKPQQAPLAQNYIIQLASYKTKATAQKEAQILKKKGYTPLVLSKSGYAVLYVGGFSDKEKAESLLSELKKRYNDCIIRRL